MSKTLYLIDGHAQIFRAYYAPFRDLTSPSGEPTRATHVFFQTLLNLIRDKQPDYLAVALDAGDEGLERKQIYPEYKAHRDPAPEDLHIQEARIIDILERTRVPMLRLTEFEADDILATLAEQHASDDCEVVLVSRDKDLEQLLRPQVVMYDPMKDELITADSLPDKKGWSADLAIEAQILTGDTVDNVPGVKGIGPKTAAKLLAKYGSARGVVDHADELTPKQRENVLAFAPLVETVRELVTLRRNVPVALELDAARLTAFDWQAMRAAFEALGMRRLPTLVPGDGGLRSSEALPSDVRRPASKVGERASSVGAPAAAGDGPDRSAALLEAARAIEVADPAEYVLVNTSEQLAQLVEQLSAVDAFAIDTETTGLRAVDAELVGVALSWRGGQGVYLPVLCQTGPALPLAEVQAALRAILRDPAKTKVAHNLKYDLPILDAAGLELAGPLFDTMLAAFAVDPLRSGFSLAKLAHEFFDHEMIPITDLIGKGKQQLRMDQVMLDRITEYAAEDTDLTWRLYELLAPQLEPGGVAELFWRTEMPLVHVLSRMERHGVALDVSVLESMGEEMSARTEAIRGQVIELAGREFNLDSPKQLAEVLFDEQEFRVVKKTKTARSTDAETLQALARETDSALPKLLLEYRELQKLSGTYVNALPNQRARTTGRIHTSYHQTGAITGRLSSSEPNLQNIPIRTALGRQIRSAFVPREADWRLVVADYSQVELRVLAHFSADDGLRAAFAEDRDIHAVVASEVNGVALDEVTAEMRGRAKAVNFGIIYGQTAFGLAAGTGMSRSEAQDFIDGYFARFPRIKAFIAECIDTARTAGEVKTILGRRRPIRDISSRSPQARAQAERLAVNTVVQGSAADLIKTAMIQLDARIRDEDLPLRMLLQVHDELVCEAPQDRAEEMGSIVVDTMRHALELTVPLKVDVGMGANWLDAK